MDLDAPADNLRALIKARASLDPVDTVTWFAGDVHAWEPGGKHTHVFGFEGYNAARAIAVEGGYDLLTREAAFYLDPRTRTPLERWSNPWTGEDVEVVQVWNDPVNMRFREQNPWGPFRVPSFTAGDDVLFKMDVFLAYPSALPRAEFPDNSQDDLYQAVEMFGFACARADLDDDAVRSARTRISWTRIAPWLPFMRMADRPGQLVYHCEGVKLAGYGALPSWIRERVEAADPVFATAPETWSEPNETSWTHFRKRASAR